MYKLMPAFSEKYAGIAIFVICKGWSQNQSFCGIQNLGVLC